MSKDEYRHRIHLLRARADEVRAASENMHHSEPRATLVRMAETYEKAARQLESILERGLPDDVG